MNVEMHDFVVAVKDIDRRVATRALNTQRQTRAETKVHTSRAGARPEVFPNLFTPDEAFRWKADSLAGPRGRSHRLKIVTSRAFVSYKKTGRASYPGK